MIGALDKLLLPNLLLIGNTVIAKALGAILSSIVSLSPVNAMGIPTVEDLNVQDHREAELVVSSYIPNENQAYSSEVPEPPEPDIPTHSCESVHHEHFLEVAGYAEFAGFFGDELYTAVAVAFAESGGRLDAVNRNSDKSVDRGIWQINSIHGFEDLFDPYRNALAAKHVFDLQGWEAWYAHTPKGGRFGSGERFVYWLQESRCSVDFFVALLFYEEIS